jgi:hypothetical protein
MSKCNTLWRFPEIDKNSLFGEVNIQRREKYVNKKDRKKSKVSGLQI